MLRIIFYSFLFFFVSTRNVHYDETHEIATIDNGRGREKDIFRIHTSILFAGRVCLHSGAGAPRSTAVPYVLRVPLRQDHRVFTLIKRRDRKGQRYDSSRCVIRRRYAKRDDTPNEEFALRSQRLTRSRDDLRDARWSLARLMPRLYSARP